MPTRAAVTQGAEFEKLEVLLADVLRAYASALRCTLGPDSSRRIDCGVGEVTIAAESALRCTTGVRFI